MSATSSSSAVKRRSSKTNDIKRRTSLDSSDGNSSCGEAESVISESFIQTMKSTSNDSHHISGYLLKKSKNDVWQKRYFETNSTFLTYYKSKKMSKLLAALNMASVGEITVVGHVSDSIGEGTVFQLELKDRNYVLRTSSTGEADKWTEKLRMLRDEARASSIPEETALDISTRGSTTNNFAEPISNSPTKGKSSESRQSTPPGEWTKANVEIGTSSQKDTKGSCCVVS